MKNMVTCTKRTYNIQTSDGVQIEVESKRTLSDEITAMLLKDDKDIGSFLDNCNIVNIDFVDKKTSLYKNRRDKKLKKRLSKKHIAKKVEKDKEKTINDRDTQSDNECPLSPYDRINMMIKMEGEFTRLDYQKFMEEKGYKMSDFMGHEDIKDAILLKRISPTGERLEKGRKVYRIIDVMPIEKYMYRKILKNHTRN